MVLPSHYTQEIALKILSSLISGMGGLIYVGLKGYESIIHDHERDLWVSMVGWVDVPDSDRGEVDIFS